METIFINSIDDLFIRKNIKFTLLNLMHETLKLYIPDDCECNLIFKMCALVVNIRFTMKLYYTIELYLTKKQNFQKLKI